MAPLSRECSLRFHLESTVYKSCHFGKYGRKNFFKASTSIASAETCFLTFRGRDLPLTGLKTPHNGQPILMVMVTNLSIFAFLDLELRWFAFLSTFEIRIS